MRQSFKRLVSMILALLMVIVAFIIYFQFTEPEYRDIQLIKNEEASRRSFVQKQQSAIAQVKKLIAAYKNDTDFQALVATSFPSSPELSSAIIQLSGLINLNNLSVQSINVVPVKAQDPRLSASKKSTDDSSSAIIKPISTTAYRIQLVGSYEDLKNFLKKVETNIKIFDVVSFNIVPLLKSNQDLYNYTVEVATYYQE